MFINTVKELLQAGLDERQDLFLIDFTIVDGNAISIIIDGDEGVKVEDCVFISRAIESNIDREEYDFSLDVASAGATSSLTLPRQFYKSVGRVLEVKTADNKHEGLLVDATDKTIDLEWKIREPKPIGKGKVTVQKKVTLNYSDIKDAKVVIKF
jgi:ribosome maturation factor RimP